MLNEEGLRPRKAFAGSPAFKAHIDGICGDFHFQGAAIRLGKAPADLLDGDDALGVFRFNADTAAGHLDPGNHHAGGGVEPAIQQGAHDGRRRPVAGVRHVPAQPDVARGVVAVVVGKPPDAAALGQEQVPFIGRIGAAVMMSDDAVVDFDTGVAAPGFQVVD